MGVEATSKRRIEPRVDAALAEFCSVSAPVLTYLAVDGAIVVFIFSTAAYGRMFGENTIVDWIVKFNVQFLYVLCMVVPAVFVVMKGRHYLRRALAGTLSLRSLIATGIVAGVSSMLISSCLLQIHHTVFLRLPHALTSLDPVAIIIAPVGEELLFQGGIQTSLQRLGPVVAVSTTTVLFLAIHFFGISLETALFDLLPALLVFALVRQVTGSLGAAMIAHATCNLLAPMIIVRTYS